MSLTKPLNSKVNMKQYSDADLPLNPKQPAVARYAAESTLNQTVINLPFQVDTVNASDSFILSVDGKVLTPGSLNDYQFTAVDSFGFSSTITLNYGIAAGLNIQGIKLGLKKETEFLQDARFTALYEGIDQGLQGFVRTSDLMVATTSTGAPATGSFYSTIVNRASMPDLRTDLKARMGIERIATQQIYQVQNEFGPNGEPIFAVLNDSLGQIRLGGAWSSGTNSTLGNFISTATVNDFIEVTFFGTGLNLLVNYGFAYDLRAAVDGGSEGSNIFPAASSQILISRNYAPNQIISVVAGLSQAVHTVRIRNNNANGLNLMGVEILNEASTVKIQPGSSYLAGKKITTIAQQSLTYNSSFESGTLGTRGGRVVVYQKSDGTIAKAVQPTNASQQNLTSADHTNEEVVRSYNWREFGAGRTDDFSRVAGNQAAAFTLDDGTTTLIGSQVRTSQAAVSAGPDSIGVSALNGTLTLTFVGTGLDIELYDNIGTRQYTVSVDGSASIGTMTSGSTSGTKILKVVSGLPYGSHVIRFTNPNGVDGFYITRFIVYQPKKPSIPAGAVELADYNILSSSTNGTVGVTNLTSGTLRKANTREAVYVNGTGGTSDWVAGIDTTNEMIGFSITSDRLNAYSEFIFFGTGVDFRYFAATNRSSNISVSLQSLSTGGSLLLATTANFPGASFSQYGVGSFASGILSQNGTNTAGSGLVISGLTLGLWKIRLNNNSAGGFISVSAFDVLTPIHSAKSNLYADLQNTLAIGSNAISDNRKTSTIKDTILQPKAWAQAVGVVANPTTTSSVLVPMPDMSLTIKTNGNPLEISAAATVYTSLANTNIQVLIYVDGVAVGKLYQGQTVTGGNSVFTLSPSVIIPASAGVHKVDLYWAVTGGATGTAQNDYRLLKAREI